MRTIAGKNKIKMPAACLVLLSIVLNLTLVSSLIRLSGRDAVAGARSVIRMYNAALPFREEDTRGYRLLVSRDRLRFTGGISRLFSAGILPESGGTVPFRVCGSILPGEDRHEPDSVKIVNALHLKDGMK